MKTTITLLAVSVVCLGAERAAACGCFTPPDPTVPVVQAGERILFSVKDGQVTAVVQVQYSGAGGEFGWLLPLPAVPSLELGTDELFVRLTTATQPRYQLRTSFDASCRAAGGFGGGAATGGGAGGGPGGFADAGASGAPSPLVVQDAVGPYDYAVLRADSRAAMLEWLGANRYFVPAGTDDAVAPYIRPGAYFLALKLRPGNGAGDLVPVVLRYQSDLGVIPLTLTATGAEENMAVQVWMLGEGRAIPRNFHHTVLNDALIDWPSAGANYEQLVIRAVNEAPEHHTFVTEYAGSSEVMKGVLAPPTRFGTQAGLAAQPDAAAFLDTLYATGFAATTFASPTVPVLPGPLKATLLKYLPPPEGVTPDTFFRDYRQYVLQAPPQNYQPEAMAAELWERVVAPTRAASALFDERPFLTRLYTRLSPADMSRDPAFSFNPGLPGVSNRHQATMQVHCDSSGQEGAATLTTEQGWSIHYPQGRFGRAAAPVGALPASLRIEVLTEEGPPQVLMRVDPALPVTPGGRGCAGAPGLAVVGLALFALRRARRRR